MSKNTTISREIKSVIEMLQSTLIKIEDRSTGGSTAVDCRIDEKSPSAHDGRIIVYWLGSGGLARLSKSLPGCPRVARIGCSIEPDIDVRLCSASADAYGSVVRDQSGIMREEPGFTRWVMQAIHTKRVSEDPCITARTRTIEVDLPAGMTRRMFDRQLHVALSSWSLSDQYPDHARFTRYSMGADRISLAQEIYVGLDPRHDGDRLLGLVETIVAAHRVRQEALDRKVARHPDLPFSPPLPVSAGLPEPLSRRMSPAQINAMRTRMRWERNRIA